MRQRKWRQHRKRKSTRAFTLKQSNRLKMMREKISTDSPLTKIPFISQHQTPHLESPSLFLWTIVPTTKMYYPKKRRKLSAFWGKEVCEREVKGERERENAGQAFSLAMPCLPHLCTRVLYRRTCSWNSLSRFVTLYFIQLL